MKKTIFEKKYMHVLEAVYDLAKKARKERKDKTVLALEEMKFGLESAQRTLAEHLDISPGEARDALKCLINEKYLAKEVFYAEDDLDKEDPRDAFRIHHKGIVKVDEYKDSKAEAEANKDVSSKASGREKP